jgi:hypothetical protein
MAVPPSGKVTGADINRDPLVHSIFNQLLRPTALRHDTIPIAEAAQRLRGLVQPRFIPPGDTSSLFAAT